MMRTTTTSTSGGHSTATTIKTANSTSDVIIGRGGEAGEEEEADHDKGIGRRDYRPRDHDDDGGGNEQCRCGFGNSRSDEADPAQRAREDAIRTTVRILARVVVVVVRDDVPVG